MGLTYEHVCNSTNNLLSYFGLIDATKSASYTETCVAYRVAFAKGVELNSKCHVAQWDIYAIQHKII